jgi:hypothetical protein
MLIFKNVHITCDKISPPPKKKEEVKVRKEKNRKLSKVCLQNLFKILFLVHFLTKVHPHCWKQDKILSFLRPNITYVKKITFHLSERSFLNAFPKIFLKIFFNPKLYDA